MTPRDLWQRLRGDLVDRRLLPIPVLLLAGVIAVPVLATQDRSSAGAAAPPESVGRIAASSMRPRPSRRR